MVPSTVSDVGAMDQSIASPSSIASTAAAQADAFHRRQQFLKMWIAAEGSSVTFRTREATECEAIFLATDAALTLFQVDDLQTPLGTYPCASLRASELLHVDLGPSWRLDRRLPPAPAWVYDSTTRLHPVPAGAGAVTAGGAADGASNGNDADADADADTLADGPAPSPQLEKYWVQRYMLFHRYEEGVRIDAEGWYSVTPEVLAAHMAERCACDLVVDAFAGVGGNSIQFALTCERVIAVDIDAGRLELARHNAGVYGVADRIEWVAGDWLELVHRVRADVVFLSPPWGGPAYSDAAVFDVRTMMGGGIDGEQLLRDALAAAPNVAYFLPKNADAMRLEQLAAELDVGVEVEECRLNGHVKGLMVYFGFDEEEWEEEGPA